MRKAHQRAERAADQRGDEQARRGHAVAAARARVKHRPPEQQRAHEEAAHAGRCASRSCRARGRTARARATPTSRRAWTTVAVTGSVSRFHSAAAATSSCRRATGAAAAAGPRRASPPALDAASSRVATSMISSCSIMCMVKLRSPASCSGETSARVSTVQPDRNSAGARAAPMRACDEAHPADDDRSAAGERTVAGSSVQPTGSSVPAAAPMRRA